MQVHRLEDLEVGGLEGGVKEIVAAAPDDVDVGDGLAAGALEAAVGVFELPADVVGPAGDAVVDRDGAAVGSRVPLAEGVRELTADVEVVGRDHNQLQGVALSRAPL